MFSLNHSPIPVGIGEKCLYDPKSIFCIFIQCSVGIKKRRIWCQFRIRWKSIKKVYLKKVRGLKTIVHSSMNWTFFNWFEISIEFFVFLYRSNKVLKSFHPKIPHTKSLNLLFSSLISLFGICSFMSLIFCMRIESIKVFLCMIT